MKIEEMTKANRADCSGCEACANICPKNAIEMTRDAEGFAYPKINPELCIKCGRCDATCPALNFKAKTVDAFPETFVAIHPDKKILRHSSSGGAFTALSEIILHDGGIVFGASFDKNWHVIHTSAKNLDELENLRRSKYVQSKIGDVYRQVKDALKDKKVLFSGTPCQCAGLKHFLGSDPENLLTVEIICHGVPSPALWEYYVGEVSKMHEISYINFRSKRDGWSSNFEIHFLDRYYFFKNNGTHIYGKLFLNGIAERPSCHSCKFKFPNGQADLTLGDAWGIKKFAPKMFDNLGVSEVIINTTKGKNFFEQTDMKKKPVKFIDALKNNTHITTPTIADTRRNAFFDELATAKDWFAVMQKYRDQKDEELRKELNKKKAVIFRKNLNEIAAQIRQKFEENILVVGAPAENNFEQQFPNCGVYFLNLNDKGKLICTEKFSLITFEQKDVDTLNDFVQKFRITKVIVNDPMNFESPIVSEWLKTSNLPK